MIAALVRIAPLAPAESITAADLQATLYAAVTPDDRAEHIRVRAGPGYIDVLAFIDVTDTENAHRHLRQLVARTILASPRLGLWRVI